MNIHECILQVHLMLMQLVEQLSKYDGNLYLNLASFDVWLFIYFTCIVYLILMNDFCVITTLVVNTVIYYIAGFRQICFFCLCTKMVFITV